MVMNIFQAGIECLYELHMMFRFSFGEKVTATSVISEELPNTKVWY